MKGVLKLNNELKKRVNLSLTPTGVEGLEVLAARRGLSRSELVEQIGRGHIPLPDEWEDETESESPLQSSTSPPQTLPLNQRHKLSTCAGAYAFVDYHDRTYEGYCFNLWNEFRNKTLLEKLKRHFPTLGENAQAEFGEIEDHHNHLHIFWIECCEQRQLRILKKILAQTLYQTRIAQMFKALSKPEPEFPSYQAS
jgi:hypothetical protein